MEGTYPLQEAFGIHDFPICSFEEHKSLGMSLFGEHNPKNIQGNLYVQKSKGSLNSK
jgi:hypothetical protein